MNNYPGSKAQAGVFQRIIGQMPPHSTYVEPFFGSGQVFWRKRRAASSIVIDLNPLCIAKAGAEAGVSAIPGDALKILPALVSALTADTVIYCDPPYVLSTRQNRFYYDHEMSDEQHASLLTLLEGLKCRVLLSGYMNEIYSPRLRKWRCLQYRTRTRGKTVTECLWLNFAEPAELHDWRYAGENFRQRLRFKRLANRWLARLESMAERQRGYVLDAVHQRYFQREGPGNNASIGVEDLKASQEILVRVKEHKVNGSDPCYVATCFLGQVPIFSTQQCCLPLHAMYECQDWATRQGKALRFEQNFV